MYPYNIDNSIKKVSKEMVFAKSKTYDDQLLELLIMAIEHEDLDAKKYKTMSQMAKTEEEIEILRSIYLDGSRHKALLTEIYTNLTDEIPTLAPQTFTFDSPTLKDEYSKNILTEIEAARFYRDLGSMFSDQISINTITSMLNDEQNHATLNIYLYHKSK